MYEAKFMVTPKSSNLWTADQHLQQNDKGIIMLMELIATPWDSLTNSNEFKKAWWLGYV